MLRFNKETAKTKFSLNVSKWWFFTYAQRHKNGNNDIISTPALFCADDLIRKLALANNHLFPDTNEIEIPLMKPNKKQTSINPNDRNTVKY